MSASASPFQQSAEALANLYGGNPMIRVVNFHNTPHLHADRYRRELEHYSQQFTSVNEAELDWYLGAKTWNKSKPGLIVAVYEGFRNGYDVLAPLLEEFGFTGWFFIVTGFLDQPVSEQLTFAEGHRIRMHTHEYADGRYALSWDEVRQLSKKHVIAGHTRTHSNLVDLDDEQVRDEVIGSKLDLERQLGHKVRSFSSRTGPAHGEYARTDRLVEEAGYEFIFSNFRIQRIAGGKDVSSSVRQQPTLA